MPRRSPHRLLCALLALGLSLLAGCSRDSAGAPLDFDPPETQIDYAVKMSGAPDEEIDQLLRDSLQLFRRQADGAQSVAFLRRRAIQDVETAKKVLAAFGYFEADAQIDVTPGPRPEAAQDAGAAQKATTTGDAESQGSPDFATVAFALQPGRVFTLTAHRLQLVDIGETPPPALDAAKLGSPLGEAARAQPILDSEGAAVATLKNKGRPYAKLLGRDSVADLETAELEVDSGIETGPEYVFGPLRFDGLETVRREYLESYADFAPGEIWDQQKIARYQQRLSETRLFDSISVRAPDERPEGREAAPQVRAQEAKHRTISAGLRYDTSSGPLARAAFEHRNLFGANETLKAEALGGLREQRLNLNYRKPQYLRDGQDFLSGAEARHLEEDAFEETAFTVTAGLERKLSKKWTVGAGGLIEVAEIQDRDGEQRYALGGLPVYAAFDDTDDTLNPTKGERLRLEATPFFGRNDRSDNLLFFRLDATGSVYRPLDEARRFVVAGRARVASITAEDVRDVPAGRRLYSGGGGSVRGYENRSIGPLDNKNDPIGGLSAVELGGEIRALVYDPFGIAAFVEAGSVNTEPYPDFSEPLVAAGLGLRYYSPIGPIRADVGVPLNPRGSDQRFQIYLSIGQAY